MPWRHYLLLLLSGLLIWTAAAAAGFLVADCTRAALQSRAPGHTVILRP